MAKKSTNDADFIKALRVGRGAADLKPELEAKPERKAGMVMSHPPEGPGKSLEEMLLEAPPEMAATQSTQPLTVAFQAGDSETEIPLALVDPSPYQPRLVFDEDTIQDLKESIRENGQINAIIVRRKQDGRYELVGGERRCHALTRLHRTTVRAVVKELSDSEAALWALADNEAREDLCDYERGKKYRQMLESKLVADQQDLAAKIGRNKNHVSRCLAFFRLPQEIMPQLDGRPGFLSARAADEFAAHMKHPDLVIDAIDKVLNGSEVVNALNWLKGQIKARENPASPRTHHEWSENGRMLGEMRIEGRRLVITCAPGVTPDEMMNRILLGERPK